MAFALKEMMIAIGTYAITNGKEIKVKAPADKLREFVDKLRKAAKDAAPKEGEAAEADKKPAGGMFGGLAGAVPGGAGAALAAAGAVAGSALEAGKAAAQQGVAAAINAFADGVDTGVQKLDGEFAKVGDEVTTAKGDVIIETYKAIINKKTVDKPVIFIRGADPHGQAEAQAVAKDMVSKYITDNSKAELIDEMLKATKEAVSKTAAVTAWKSAIDKFNEANNKLGEMGEIAAKCKQEPITLDIEKYIVEQIVAGYHDLMANQEVALRAAPNSVSGCPKATTFERCWKIDDIDYNAFKALHFADFQSGK